MMSKLKKSLWTAITLFMIAALFTLAGVFMLTPKRKAHADTEEDHDHIYENGACTVCGSEAQLYWGIDSDGVLTLSSYESTAAPNLYSTIEVGGNEYPAWYDDRSDITSVTVDTYAYAPVSTSLWFKGCGNLTAANLTGLDTSRVENMSSMFLSCTNLESVNLSGLDTSDVTSMGSMFYYCRQLTSLDLSGFNTASLTSMHTMFYACGRLTSLTFSSSFHAENVTDMRFAFYGCWNLTSLDLSSFNATSVENMASMFESCNGLNTITVSDSLAQKLSETSDDTYLYSNKNWYDGSGPAYTDSNRFNQAGTYTTVQPPFEVTVGTDITYYRTITGAWAAANNASAAATVKMYADAETQDTLTVEVGKEITLDLNGCMLEHTGEHVWSFIYVYGKFTLDDNSDKTTPHTITNPVTNEEVTIDGGLITGGTMSGVSVEGGGEFTMENGAVCGHGGGVNIYMGTFTMNGGRISENASSGVYANLGGTFTMNGGTISGNSAGAGGGVHVRGGIVYVDYGWDHPTDDGGTFIMTGGTISGNTAGNGGGVFVGGWSVNVDTESLNLTARSNSVNKSGVGEGGKFIMTGGTISGNTATEEGGGVFVGYETYDGENLGGRFEITGAPVITGNQKAGNNDNVYLDGFWGGSAIITVTGALEKDGKKAQIGVSSTGAVITGFPQGGDPWDYFIPDNPANNCMYFSNPSNGEVTIGTHTGGTATCTQKAHCANCGEEYGEVDINNHVWNEGTFTTQPTCTEGGEKTFTCTLDNTHTKTESVETLGHDFSGDYEKDSEGHRHVCQREGCTVTDTKEDHSGGTATCIAKALCEKCGTAYGEIDSNNHVWNEGAFITQPTCTEGGEKNFICTLDNTHTKTESVEALGHDEERHGAQAATCTEAGWNEYVTCSRCDYNTKEEVPALGHTLTHVAQIPATKKAEGNLEYWECENCDKYFSDEEGAAEITDKSSVVISKLENKSSLGIILGSVFGVLAAAGIIILIIFFVKKKKDDDDDGNGKAQISTESSEQENGEDHEE